MTPREEMEHSGSIRRGRAAAYVLYRARQEMPQNHGAWLELAQCINSMDALAFAELPRVTAERGEGMNRGRILYTITHPTGHRARAGEDFRARDELAMYGMDAGEIDAALKDAAETVLAA